MSILFTGTIIAFQLFQAYQKYDRKNEDISINIAHNFSIEEDFAHELCETIIPSALLHETHNMSQNTICAEMCDMSQNTICAEMCDMSQNTICAEMCDMSQNTICAEMCDMSQNTTPTIEQHNDNDSLLSNDDYVTINNNSPVKQYTMPVVGYFTNYFNNQ